MEKFKSVVVFDLETTGLTSHSGKPKIIELSMVGMLREHINDNVKCSGALPRVLNKVNMCFYPKKMIHFEASDITGLDNLMLQEFPPWDINACALISSFLKHMPPPVCVVAHNGIKFDFPILKSEILAHGQTLPDDILWADSLSAFKDLFPSKQNNVVSGIHPLDHQSSISSESVVTGSSPPKFLLLENSGSSLVPLVRSKAQEENETTPKRETLVTSVPPLMKKPCIDFSNCARGNSSFKVKKQLFSAEHQPLSFRLEDIYKYFYKSYPPNSHCAEADAVTLLKCILAATPKVLSYFDFNHLQFSEIRALW